MISLQEAMYQLSRLLSDQHNDLYAFLDRVTKNYTIVIFHKIQICFLNFLKHLHFSEFLCIFLIYDFFSFLNLISRKAKTFRKYCKKY